MLSKMKFLVFGLAGLSMVFSTACKIQPDHPNQLNTFDGSSYDSLTLAHGALTSLRGQISGGFPKYAPVFNEAATSYEAAFNAYAAFRIQPQQAAVTTALSELTLSLVNLENVLIGDAHADSEATAAVRRKASRIRARLGRNITISDILTELEIAASVAETIPGAQPYSQIASMIIQATSQALGAEKATVGQPIDLTTIQPVPVIQ